jgi:hypothetical protein
MGDSTVYILRHLVFEVIPAPASPSPMCEGFSIDRYGVSDKRPSTMEELAEGYQRLDEPAASLGYSQNVALGTLHFLIADLRNRSTACG